MQLKNLKISLRVKQIIIIIITRKTIKKEKKITRKVYKF